jgi:hypothetical protein
MPEYAQWVASRTRPQDIVIAMDEAAFIQYYGQREILIRKPEPDDKEIDLFFAEGIDKALAEGRRVYIIQSALAYDTSFKFKNRLLGRYKIIYIGFRINEDWHHALLSLELWPERLWEIKKKSR